MQAHVDTLDDVSVEPVSVGTSSNLRTPDEVADTIREWLTEAYLRGG